jgi:CHRD domain
MKKLALAVAIVSLGAVALIATAIAKNGSGGGGNGGHSFHAKLTGYEEIVFGAAPSNEGGAVSTTGHGRFSARIRNDPLRIDYRLRYEDLQGDDTLFAHIHFGQRSTIGGIVAFLCDSDASNNATLPDCTNTNGDISGTIFADEVTGSAAFQGIAAGELTELIRAMRKGAAYVNVHTAPGPPPAGDGWPTGEIRGQIDHGFHFGFFRGKGKGKRGDDD